MCEGVNPISVIRQTFNTKREREDWQARFCTSIKKCEECPIYKVANRKYDRQGD